jgi:hypothetical protein
MERQYEIGRIIGLELWLHNPYDMTELPYYYFHPQEEMDKLSLWVQENNLGTRISLNSWKFNDQQGMAMFILKWIK